MDQKEIDEHRRHLLHQVHRLSSGFARQLKLNDVKYQDVGDITISSSYHPVSKLVIVHVDGVTSEAEALETLRKWLDPNRKETPELP